MGSPAADPQSRTVLEFPEVASPVGSDILYLLRGTGVDRDRRITVEALRAFCTAQGVRLVEVTLAAPGAITTVDVSGTSNVIVVVWGQFPNPTDNRLNVVGEIPEGCSATILSGHLGIIDLRLDGNAPTNTPEDLDFGLLGRAELVSHGGTFLLTVVNDSRWIKMRLGEETTRAQDAESTLAGLIQGEATQRQDAITQTQALVSAEVDRATAAEAYITNNRAHIAPQTVTLWTNTDIYSQDDGAITCRGPATVAPSGNYVNGEYSLVIESQDSQLVSEDCSCWRPTGTSGPIIGAGNTLSTKWQLGLVAATPINVTGGSPTRRVAMLQWTRSLGKIVVEKLPTSVVPDPAATVGLLLPAVNANIFEELLVRVLVADDVSCEVIVQHPTNGHGLSIPYATINDGRNWWVRARHVPGGDWRMDCWWEPKRL